MEITSEASVWIDAPPDTVFEHIGDPTNHGAWSAKAPLKVSAASEAPIAVGSEFTSSSKFLGKDVGARIRITQYDSPKQVAFDAAQDDGTFTHAFTLEAKDGGTLVTRTVGIPSAKGVRGFLAKRVAPGAIRKEATKALERLKAQLEG
ncbi:MAG TPA: SRPBCC family protein [Actinomycetota bacterium]